MKPTFFITGLEESRLYGLRLNFKPMQNFEFGLSQNMLLGDTNAEPRPFLRILGIDANFRMPSLRYSEFFVELMTDDFSKLSDSLQESLNYHSGVFFPRIVDNGSVSGRIAVTKTSKTAYGSVTFPPSYTNQSRFLGSNIGPDALEVFSEIELMASEATKHSFFSSIKHFQTTMLYDKEFGWTMSHRLTQTSTVHFSLGYGYGMENVFFGSLMLSLYQPELRVKIQS